MIYISMHMGFWPKIEKYTLQDTSRVLKIIPQEFYYVGVEGTVIESFPIWRIRKEKEILSYLKPKEKIILILCACEEKPDEPSGSLYNDWYLIKSENGILGWVKDFRKKVEGLPAAD